MDFDRLDVLARSFASSGSRRTLLGLLAAVPGMGGLTTFTAGDLAAKNRRRRMKRQQKRRKHSGAGKKNSSGKSCRPRPDAETCAGKCGSVRNNCQKRVDCGPCLCDPACSPCERCTGTTCAACGACCLDVCCDSAGAVCHASSGACCNPDANELTCAGKCGEIVNNCGFTVDCGPCREGLTCAACAALNDLDSYDRAADCCGEQVCDCGQIEYYPDGYVVQSKRPGVCRPNRAPVALNVHKQFALNRHNPEYHISLGGYEPDHETFVHFRIASQPQHGMLVLFNHVYTGEPGTPALPAPPIPADAQWNCNPRCLSDAGDQCEYEVCSAEACPLVICSDCPGASCPEGTYHHDHVVYIPHSVVSTEPDSFTYAAVDGFGAEGPPALVTINFYDTE